MEDNVSSLSHATVIPDVKPITKSGRGPVEDEATSIALLDPDQKEKSHGSRVKSEKRLPSTTPTIIVAVLTVAALAICLWIVGSLAHTKASYTSSLPIGHGGSFSQPQAKVLDLIASVVVAPLSVGLFNLYCFQIARISIVNERSGLRHSLPLRTLVEVSTTDWGSYSPFKLYELVRVKQARVVMLALVTLSSAIYFSALSNIVAYEAFTQEAGRVSNVTLQHLYAKHDTNRSDSDGEFAGSQMPLLSTTEQQAKFNSQWFQVLMSLSYSPADPFLECDAYTGINITNASLARLSFGITNLLAVPAYELTYDCSPVIPHTTELTSRSNAEQTLEITVSLSNDPKRPGYYLDNIKNGLTAMMNPTSVYQFNAFKGIYGPAASVMLGNIQPVFNQSNHSTITSFGSLPHYVFNNTLATVGVLKSGFINNSTLASVWVVSCTLSRQQGTVDMNREVNATSADWKRSEFTPLPFPETNPEPLTLITRDLQISPQFDAPTASIPGLGAALAASSNITTAALSSCFIVGGCYEDFNTWAKNFLYAEGEARRIAYEVALEGTDGDDDDLGLDYTVIAKAGVLRYYMTYVPWILIVGLLALVTAGVLVLLLETTGSSRLEKTRVLTPLRVFVDAWAGLETEQHGVDNADDEEIEAWAKGTKVRYVRVADESNEVGVRLKTA